LYSIVLPCSTFSALIDEAEMDYWAEYLRIHSYFVIQNNFMKREKNDYLNTIDPKLLYEKRKKN
jgi:hypothetical protein